MGHLKLVLAFFSFVIMCAGVLAAAYFYKHYVEPEQAIVREIEEVKNVPISERPPAPDLGLRQFAKAVEFLEDGELLAAREQLYYLMEHYSDSVTYSEAKRLIGEINLDMLLSEMPVEGKSEYVVENGDVLSLIARDHKCTINYIMRVNGRTTDKIHKGDRLMVYPLDQFSMVIDKSDLAIRVERDGRLFKEYPVTKLALSPMLKAPASGKVSGLSAWGDSGNLAFNSIDYLGAPKGISTSKTGLMIRSSVEPTKVDVAGGSTTAGPGVSDGASQTSSSPSTGTSGYGVIVTQEDMEELFAYIRPGTPIRLIE